MDANAAFIEREIEWFTDAVQFRMQRHSGDERLPDPLALEPPDLVADSPYAQVIARLELEPEERLILMLAFLPHIHPRVLDLFLIQNEALQRRFTEFGGVTDPASGSFLPTGETALFLLAGDDVASRLHFRSLFDPSHRLFTENVLRLDARSADQPQLAGALHLTAEYVERLASGREYQPPYGTGFPAQRLTTTYEWDDLILDRATREEVEDMISWARYEETLLVHWNLERRIKPGFRALFYGPPGTGKTLTASLLGKVTRRPVYRIDLSKVISKWIGETEKNLASVFDEAQHQRWILFFDEAEALFGKRTETRNANDRAANQQVSYLLQRIEGFPGIIILATNLQRHLDEAFARRFQSMIRFPLPAPEQRLHLWEANFRDMPLAADVDLRSLAMDHELSGGSIVNVLRYACLRGVSRDPREIRQPDLVRGIEREMNKEGRFLEARR
ncbi:MAG TPA: ATP-binding protein [Thermoanaerobaculia bacterium]|jgi:hypothetical protein